MTSNFIQAFYIPHGQTNETLSFNLTNLKGGVSYDIKMQAYTATGSGPNSTIVTAITIRGFLAVICFVLTSVF